MYCKAMRRKGTLEGGENRVYIIGMRVVCIYSRVVGLIE